MALLDSDIKQTSPKIVIVDSKYLAYLHEFDNRVSLKKDRPYVGLSVRINNRLYVIPLTSQTTQERKKRGLKKRNSLTTTSWDSIYYRKDSYIPYNPGLF